MEHSWNMALATNLPIPIFVPNSFIKWDKIDLFPSSCCLLSHCHRIRLVYLYQPSNAWVIKIIHFFPIFIQRPSGLQSISQITDDLVTDQRIEIAAGLQHKQIKQKFYNNQLKLVETLIPNRQKSFGRGKFFLSSG